MEYETINKFDRMLGGLQDGNALRTKPSTIQNIESITGSAETFTIQTVRAEYPEKVQNGWETKTVTRTGDFVVIVHTDKEGTTRLILPPKVTSTIARQKEAMDKQSAKRMQQQRSERGKTLMAERMANGYVPKFAKSDKTA